MDRVIRENIFVLCDYWVAYNKVKKKIFVKIHSLTLVYFSLTWIMGYHVAYAMGLYARKV